jgi:hypothetical protein
MNIPRCYIFPSSSSPTYNGAFFLEPASYFLTSPIYASVLAILRQEMPTNDDKSLDEMIVSDDPLSLREIDLSLPRHLRRKLASISSD